MMTGVCTSHCMHAHNDNGRMHIALHACTYWWRAYIHRFTYISMTGRMCIVSMIARFMGPTWGPSGANRTQVGPKLSPWILLSGIIYTLIDGGAHGHRINYIRMLTNTSYCGPVAPYGAIDLSQHWFRYRFVAWWHKVITLTDIDWLVELYDIHMRAISPWVSELLLHFRIKLRIIL